MFDNNGDTTSLTQKVILRVWAPFSSIRGRRGTLRRGWRGDRDAVADSDGVVADQDVLDDETHDSLALDDIKRVGGTAQSGEERRESLGQAQEHGAVVSLVGDRLQLGAQRLLPVTQRRHSLAQLLERDEFLLISVEKPFDALANTRQLSLRALLAPLRWIGSACPPCVSMT